MIAVASVELCQELHELSGWDSEIAWFQGYFEDQVSMRNDPPLQTTLQGDPPEKEITPAYDLGYLLRKLQYEDLTVLIRYNRDMGGRAGMSAWDNKWCIGTFDMPQGEYPIADIPEDAACTLAIELFKQGVLVREPQS